MSTQEFGPRRTRATTKPRIICPPVIFYLCSHCGRQVQLISLEPDQNQVSCCGSPMDVLVPKGKEEVKDRIRLDYKITGGYNNNAVSVSFQSLKQNVRPLWMYLKTFTGGYLRYLDIKKRSPLIFPLADEDAYVYCDQDPCLECTFQCKRGYVIYCYLGEEGLIEIPLDRMTAQWQSGAGRQSER